MQVHINRSGRFKSIPLGSFAALVLSHFEDPDNSTHVLELLFVYIVQSSKWTIKTTLIYRLHALPRASAANNAILTQLDFNRSIFGQLNLPS
jgi:hypothetical protein